MKKLFLIGAVLFGVLITGKGQSSKQRSNSKVDSLKREFIHHFKILDAASKTAKADTVYCCRVSVAFMEYHTEIEAGTMGNVLGRLGFTKEALTKWRSWYRSKYTRSKK